MGTCSSSASSVAWSSTEPQTSQTSQTESRSPNDCELTTYLELAKREFDIKYAQPLKQTADIKEFELQRTIGMGLFGRTMLAKYGNKLFALKIINKRAVVENGQVEHVLSEKRILQAVNSPFIIGLAHSFKSNSNLYLALEYLSGGEMFVHLRKAKTYTEDQVLFYISQVVLALEYLHYMKIVYRSLKVEDLSFSHDGYLKLADFSFAKVVRHQTNTLCGTPEYLAPEVIAGRSYNKSVDYWALGILIYELVAGFTPFQDKDIMKMYSKILHGKYHIPENVLSHLHDLLTKLLQSHPQKRLGNLLNGADDVKSHPWFSSIDWSALLNKRLQPPYVPSADNDYYENYEEQALEESKNELYAFDFEEF